MCVRNVREDLERSGQLLHEVAARVPNLITACTEVSTAAAAVESSRGGVRTALRLHGRLVELLELAQLVDAAVRPALHSFFGCTRCRSLLSILFCLSYIYLARLYPRPLYLSRFAGLQVRNEYYDEALDLAAFSRRLLARHPGVRVRA